MKENINIEEIEFLRTKLNDTVKKEIKNFENITGAEVISIDLQRTFLGMGDESCLFVQSHIDVRHLRNKE